MHLKDTQGDLFSFESCLPVCLAPAVLCNKLLQNASGQNNLCEFIENTIHTCFVTVHPFCFSRRQIPFGLWDFKVLS